MFNLSGVITEENRNHMFQEVSMFGRGVVYSSVSVSQRVCCVIYCTYGEYILIRQYCIGVSQPVGRDPKVGRGNMLVGRELFQDKPSSLNQKSLTTCKLNILYY